MPLDFTNSTITALDGALRTIYKGPITVQLDEQTGPIYAAINKSVDEVAGNAFKWPLQFGRSGGIGARSETDTLPNPSPRKFIQASAAPKDLFARMAISDKLIRTSKNSKASFADQLTLQMEDLTNDAKDMLRRNFVGSYTGVMGTVSANVTAAKTVTVLGGKIKAFYPGQVLDIITDPSTKSVDAQALADVDYANNTITFVNNVTCTANQLICLAGNYKRELIGLEDIFTADTTIYGIDRSVNKWFNPQLFTKSGAFDSMFFQEAIDQIEDFTGSRPDFIACNAATARAYVDEQNTYKRNMERKTVDGGYSLIAYDNVAISKEKYMPDATIYVLSTGDFKLSRLADWDWLDLDGKVLCRVQDKAAYEAAMVCYQELTCKRIRSQAKITGFTL